MFRLLLVLLIGIFLQTSCVPVDKGALEFSLRELKSLQDVTQLDELKGKVEKIIEDKCMACHGNGMRLGGYGGFEDLDALVQEGLLFNPDSPAESLFFTESESGDMPLDPRMRLTDAELADLLEWIGRLKDSK